MFGLDFSPNQRRAIYALLAIALIAISVVVARRSGSSDNQVVLKEPGSGVVSTDSDPLGGPSQPQGEIVFQVAGAVKSPGVYKLPNGSRILDGVNAAGGALPGADLQSLNLAEKISDGSKIIVPTTSNPQQGVRIVMGPGTPNIPNASSISSSATSSNSSYSDKLSRPGEGKVSINSAGIDELQRLPGVGPSTAEKILDYRRQIGRFTSIEQLMDVKGIGPKKLEKMRPFVTL